MPGEAGPRPRRLPRPPGARYGGPASPVGVAGTDRGRALVLGLGAAAVVALAFGVGVGVFDLGWGLLVIAIVGGVAIGGAVRPGAWSGQEHVEDRRLRGAAAVLALGAWGAGALLDHLLGLVTLPGSSLPLPERIAAAPFVDYLAARFGPLELLELVLLAGSAWRAAR